MKNPGSYSYFALKGDDFDPTEITNKLGLPPTKTFRKGELGEYIPVSRFTMWSISTEVGKENLLLDNGVEDLVDKLFDKIDLINELKIEYDLNSVLEIVMWIDTNEEESTPALGHNLKTIEFLYRTGTITDVDIYRFNSRSEVAQNGDL
jgi:hypothetical protein